MSGFSTNGMFSLTVATGSERAAFDTQNPRGANPQTEAISVLKLATLVRYYGSVKDKTPVSGTRYTISAGVGQETLLTGVNIEIGSVGGTDSLVIELHDSTGALVATTATAGTVAGTALSWQQIAFTTPYRAVAGTYFITVQTNGTTVRLLTYNSPTSPHLTGSSTGTMGTGAAITPPTTYTANLGPVVQIYS